MEENDLWLDEKLREMNSGRLSKVDFLNLLEEHNERMREGIELARNQITVLQTETNILREQMARMTADNARMEAELRRD